MREGRNSQQGKRGLAGRFRWLVRSSVGIALLSILQEVVYADSEQVMHGNEKPILRVLNWSHYIEFDQPEPVEGETSLERADRSPCLREFQKLNHCEVEYFEYSETFEALSRIGKYSGFYDIVIASSSEIQRMTEAGYLLPLDSERIPNSVHIAEFAVQGLHYEVGGFSRPYLYGTTGIAYRKDLIGFSRPPSWADYFGETDEGRAKQVAVLDDPQVMMSLAKIQLGYDPNEVSRAVYANAFEALNGIKVAGRISLLSADVDAIGSSLEEGTVAMAVMYSGDAVSLCSENPNIGYVVPEEGSEYYVDEMAISIGSSQVELAYAFIDFMLTPDVSARNAMATCFPTLSEEAMEIVRSQAPEQMSNRAIYVGTGQYERLYRFQDHSRWLGSYWRRFISED